MVLAGGWAGPPARRRAHLIGRAFKSQSALARHPPPPSLPSRPGTPPCILWGVGQPAGQAPRAAGPPSLITSRHPHLLQQHALLQPRLKHPGRVGVRGGPAGLEGECVCETGGSADCTLCWVGWVGARPPMPLLPAPLPSRSATREAPPPAPPAPAWAHTRPLADRPPRCAPSWRWRGCSSARQRAWWR